MCFPSPKKIEILTHYSSHLNIQSHINISRNQMANQDIASHINGLIDNATFNKQLNAQIQAMANRKLVDYVVLVKSHVASSNSAPSDMNTDIQQYIHNGYEPCNLGMTLIPDKRDRNHYWLMQTMCKYENKPAG